MAKIKTENHPKITIVLAIYIPNLAWFREQLLSLNAQTYPNLELLVWNDCPGDRDYKEITNSCIEKFPVTIYRGNENYGSTGAFAKLTELATGEYIAYCDQDDVWEKNKLEILMRKMLSKDTISLVFSDVSVIDEHDRRVANTITKFHPRQIVHIGDRIFEALLKRNFIMGCTILMKTTAAKAALPFPKEFVHDYWLGLHEAAYGKIRYVAKPLIRYRIHTTNQTQILAGVIDKNDYYKNRILSYFRCIEIVKERFVKSAQTEAIEKKYEWALARKIYFKKPCFSSFFRLLFKANNNFQTSIFEILLPVMPEFLFSKIIVAVKRGEI